MGNNPSRSSGSTPVSPHASTPHHQHNVSSGSATLNAARGGPRRRESIQALHTGPKATAAPPSASLESATARPVRTRSRSITAPGAPPSQHPHQNIPAPLTTAPPPVPEYAEPATAIPIRSGFETATDQSEEPPRQSLDPDPPTAEASNGAPTEPKPPVTPPSSRPVAVPSTGEATTVRAELPGSGGSFPGDSNYHPASSSHFSRPPRLPLPIQEELHTPGSPIVGPIGSLGPIDALDQVPAGQQDHNETIPRRGSVMSSTTADEEEEYPGGFIQEGGLPAVPTIIEWRERGEKVYVTGTFAAWDKKYRLYRDGPSPHSDALSAAINLQPGTHHLRFIVDGEMKLSSHLPTAVDFTNFLVNYVEVSPDDLPGRASPMTSKSPEDESSKSAQQPKRPSIDATGSPAVPPPTTSKPTPELRAPPGVYPPQILPPTPELRPVTPSTGLTAMLPEPPKRYHREIPGYLHDLDEAEDSSNYTRANAVCANALPAPPSLPGFLGKSILNMTVAPAKDDASVLGNPNHTVLNHLATSSIRNKVIATSATTRYKRKFLTTIMYKPTSDTGD